MRQLIDVEFVDNSNYSDNTTNDVVGMVLPHSWGPVNKVTSVDYSKFLTNYPAEATPHYAIADGCFNAGAGMMEIVRPQGSQTYLHCVLYKSKPSTKDELHADEYNTSYDNISPTGFTTFDEVIAVVASSKSTSLNKLKTLYSAISALQLALDAEHASELSAFNAALAAAKEPEVAAAIPNEFTSSDWAAEIPANASAIVTYLQGIVDSIPSIEFIVSGTVSVKLGIDRQKKLEYTTPVGGNEGMIDPADVDQVICDFVQVYPGNIPLEGELAMRVAVGDDDEGERVFNFSLIQTLNGATVAVESLQGSVVPGTLLDGQNYFITDVMNRDSLYFTAFVKVTPEELNTLIPADAEFGQQINYATETIQEITEEEIVAAYAKYFASCALSKSTLLIPTKCTEAINNAVKAAAGKRMDCCAIIGYPTDQTFDYESVEEFLQLMLGQKFAFFYAGRDTYTVKGQQILTPCIGKIAGRYCAVTMDTNINQIPSAEAYGSYPGSLVETFDEDEVLALHKLGGNSVYTTAGGPLIWGVKSLHTRQSSYFAKANVMRVIAQILYTTFPLLNQNLHTPNTTRKKATIQANRQAFLDSLISQEVLKGNSKCQCDDKNNPDDQTNGGELLIIDFDCWFVKLIERFKVRITASDSTTTVTGL